MTAAGIERIVLATILMAVGYLFMAHVVPPGDLARGARTHLCPLPGNPWLAADEIARRIDRCSWGANGWYGHKPEPQPMASFTEFGRA